LKGCRQCGYAFFDRSKEPLGGVVRDVDLRQPDQEPRLPATPLLHHDQPMTTIDATVRPRLRILGTVALRLRASLKLRAVESFLRAEGLRTA
jgi:hypothetical protein